MFGYWFWYGHAYRVTYLYGFDLESNRHSQSLFTKVIPRIYLNISISISYTIVVWCRRNEHSATDRSPIRSGSGLRCCCESSRLAETRVEKIEMSESVEAVSQYCRDRLGCYITLRERGVSHERACKILRLYDLPKQAG